MPRWTQATVDRLPRPEGRAQAIYRDPETPGLLLVVGKKARTFSYQRDLYRGARGQRTLVRTIRMALRDEEGRPVRELKLARIKAGELRALIDRGVDPLRPEEQPSGELTLGAAWDEYTAHLRRRKRADGTVKNHGYLKKQLPADMLDDLLANVRTPRIARLHKKITDAGHPYLANDVAAAIRTVYVHAMMTHGNLPPPPINKEERAGLFNDEAPRDEILDPSLFFSFWATTERLSPTMRRYWRMLLLSGARRRTMSRLLRRNVHLDKKLVYFAKDKTGPYHHPLSDLMVQMLREQMESHDGIHVFPSATDENEPLQEPKKASLGVSPHDLRRTYETVLCADCDVSEKHLKTLMNHAYPGMSRAYSVREKIAKSEKLREVQQRITRRALELVADGA